MIDRQPDFGREPGRDWREEVWITLGIWDPFVFASRKSGDLFARLPLKRADRAVHWVIVAGRNVSFHMARAADVPAVSFPFSRAHSLCAPCRCGWRRELPAVP